MLVFKLTSLLSIFLISAVKQSSSHYDINGNQVSSASVDSCATTPDFRSFLEWTLDLRTAAQEADLPQAGDNICNDSAVPPVKKVLFIGIDGLKASAVGMLQLPTFRRLERMGTYSYWAHVQSEAIVKSGPGWTSMFTGVQPSKHLVDSNDDLNDISPDYPTIFKYVKDTYPDKKIAASVSWHPLIDDIIDHQDPNALDTKYKADTDESMSEKGKEWILSKEYDFIFLDYDECDAAGHSHIFDPYLPEYRHAVEKTDALIGELVDAIITISENEEWLVIITSDHGGDGYNHGPQNEYNLRVPFLVASNGPRVNIGHMPVGDPGSQLDILPTIMHFFNGGSCVDSSYQFKLQEKPGGEKTFQNCSWVEEDEETRCNIDGVSALCPRTCEKCEVCIDSSLKMKFSLGGGRIMKKNCEWTKKKKNRCAIDGMRDSCRETCDNCHPKYNVDGQVFGFLDYKRDEPPPPPQCQPNPPLCGCDDQEQDDYRGTIATTKSGVLCQNWNSQTPHTHTRTPDNYPSAGLEENYCRNPDGEEGAWCYTTDPTIRWELCDVPSCSVE